VVSEREMEARNDERLVALLAGELGEILGVTGQRVEPDTDAGCQLAADFVPQPQVKSDVGKPRRQPGATPRSRRPPCGCGCTP
jgi:hypothetical protein